MRVNVLKTTENLTGINISAQKAAVDSAHTCAGTLFPNLTPLEKDIASFEIKTPFLERTEAEIKSVISKLLKDKPFDKGGDARVYRIMDTDYVVRVPRYKTPSLREPVDFNITEQDKINHYAAKIGKDVQIGKYIQGLNSTYPANTPNREFLQRNLNELIVSMPQESYTDCMRSLFNAFGHDMAYDYEGRNMIVNINKNRLIPLDFDYGFRCTNQTSFNPVSDMHLGLSIRDEDLQFSFIRKVVNSFGDYLRSEKKLPQNPDNFPINAKINPLGFNLLSIQNKEEFVKAVNYVNAAMAEALRCKQMNDRCPMFFPYGAVKDSVSQLKDAVQKFFPDSIKY